MFRVLFVADDASVFRAGVAVMSGLILITHRTDSEGAVVSPMSDFLSWNRAFAFAFSAHRNFGRFRGAFREDGGFWFRVRGGFS